MMIYYVLLIVSLAGAVIKNLLPKAGGKRFSTLDGLMSVNIMSGIAGMIIVAFGGLAIKNISSALVVIMALLYGIFTLAMQSFYMTAAEKGSVSVCSIIYASCFVVQTIFSAVYSGEACSPVNIFGIVVMLASLAMVSLKDFCGKNGNIISVILAVISMLFASGVGIVQKIFAAVYGKNGQNEYVFLAFMFMAVFGLLVKFMICHKNGKGKENEKVVGQNKRFFMFACAMALCVAVVNKLNVILITVLPGVLYFPVYAAGTVLCSAICSRIIFKEKLTRMQWTGMFLGVSAIVMIVM